MNSTTVHNNTHFETFRSYESKDDGSDGSDSSDSSDGGYTSLSWKPKTLLRPPLSPSRRDNESRKPHTKSSNSKSPKIKTNSPKLKSQLTIGITPPPRNAICYAAPQISLWGRCKRKFKLLPKMFSVRPPQHLSSTNKRNGRRKRRPGITDLSMQGSVQMD